jgi:myosin-crossreactive antigen
LIKVRRVVLVCALVLVALTASLLAPIVSPSVAEINSHSVQINLQSALSPLPVNLTVGQTVNITLLVHGGNTEIECGPLFVVGVPINGTLVVGYNSTIAIIFKDGNWSCYSASP